MQFSKLIALFTLAAGISATFTEIKENYSIKAECHDIKNNVIFDCGESSDIFHIKSVSYSPEHPKRGETISVNLTGDLVEDIPKGTTAQAIAYLNGNPILKKDYDFCTSVGGGVDKCPIGKGQITTTKSLQIPANLPDGSYIFDATVTTPEKKQVIHVQIKATFTS